MVLPAFMLYAALASAAPAPNTPAKARQADRTPSEAAMARACKAELDKHCPSVGDQDPRGALECLQQNEPALSAPCRSSLPAAARREKLNADRVVLCQADRALYCAKVAPRPGPGGRNRAMRACFAAHRDQLSRGCREALIKAGDLK